MRNLPVTAHETSNTLINLAIRLITEYQKPLASEGEYASEKTAAELSAEKVFLVAFIEKEQAREAHTDAFFAFRDYWKYDS